MGILNLPSFGVVFEAYYCCHTNEIAEESKLHVITDSQLADC